MNRTIFYKVLKNKLDILNIQFILQGVRVVKRKLLLTVLALAIVLLATPIIGTVMAGKGQEKLDFTLYFEAPMLTDFDPQGLGHAGPKKSAGQDYPIQKTYHSKGISQDVLTSQLTIDGNDVSHMSFASECGFEFNWHTMTASLKTKEKVEFMDGTIELKLVETAYYDILDFKGTFVRHGTGGLKGVKIIGTTSGGMKMIEIAPDEWVPEMVEIAPNVWVPVMAFEREGTVMGWSP